jgi:hypothetical protein
MKSIKYAAIAYVFVSSMSSYAMEAKTQKPVDTTAASSTTNAPMPGYRGAASPVAITAALNIPKNKKNDSEIAAETNNHTPTAGKSYDEGDYFPCGNAYVGRGYYTNDTDSGYDQ